MKTFLSALVIALVLLTFALVLIILADHAETRIKTQERTDILQTLINSQQGGVRWVATNMIGGKQFRVGTTPSAVCCEIKF